MADTIAITAATIKDENNEVAQTLLERGYLLAIHRPLLPPTREEQRLLLADAVAVLAGSEL
ncbi:MAG: hypothetical protein FJX77_18170, partial [Armatimonadetes bacterium]|nr:hypothetical protein [Armatimonadota bacterium]